VKSLERASPIPNSELPEQPKIEDFVDEDGIRTTIEYTVNEEGKKVKVRVRHVYISVI
jgi:translation initiation factor 3 subunit G